MYEAKIKKIRKLRGISQARLAEKSGLSQAAISLIEKGVKSPTLSSLEKIAKALDVSVFDLLEDDEKPLSKRGIKKIFQYKLYPQDHC